MTIQPTKFFEAIDTLIRLNEDSRLQFEDHKNHISPAQWLYEFGTVNIGVARLTGKTTYVNERASCGDLIVTRLEWLKKECYRNTCADVMTVDQLNQGIGWSFKGAKHKYNRVWFDDSWNAFSVDEQSRIYHYFSGAESHRACANMFIMLGTA